MIAAALATIATLGCVFFVVNKIQKAIARPMYRLSDSFCGNLHNCLFIHLTGELIPLHKLLELSKSTDYSNHVFDIDADLIYTRPHMTKVNGKVVIIEERITVKPTHKWKRLHISSDLIAAMQDKLTDLSDLFDIKRFGTMFATSAFETFAEINDKEEPR